MAINEKRHTTIQVRDDGSLIERTLVCLVNDAGQECGSYDIEAIKVDDASVINCDKRTQDIYNKMKDPLFIGAVNAERGLPVKAGLEEYVTYDCEITPNGNINHRKIIRVLKDGKEISRRYHRGVIHPTTSAADLSTKDVMTKAIAALIHTKEVKDAYIAEKAKNAKL